MCEDALAAASERCARASMSSELAGEPMPPAVIMQVLSISEDQLKQAQAEQKAPVASLDQFFEAM